MAKNISRSVICFRYNFAFTDSTEFGNGSNYRKLNGGKTEPMLESLCSWQLYRTISIVQGAHLFYRMKFPDISRFSRTILQKIQVKNDRISHVKCYLWNPCCPEVEGKISVRKQNVSFTLKIPRLELKFLDL